MIIFYIWFSDFLVVFSVDNISIKSVFERILDISSLLFGNLCNFADYFVKRAGIFEEFWDYYFFFIDWLFMWFIAELNRLGSIGDCIS